MIKDLPFSLIVDIVEKIKKKYYTVPWRDSYPSIYVGGEPRKIENWFRENKHSEGMLLDYNYEGQEFSLRIPWGLDSEGRQRELHFRGKKHKDGVSEVLSHLELSRYEHKEEHINEVNFSWREGTQLLISILEESPFEVIEVDT